MSNRNAGPTRIKRGGDLTFPEYKSSATWAERLMGSKKKHHRAMADIEQIVRNSSIRYYDSVVSTLDVNDEDELDRNLDIAVTHGRQVFRDYLWLLQVLDRLDTETLEFITESYGTEADNIYEALIPVYFYHVEDSGENADFIVKNAVSYRDNSARCDVYWINAFNDVRLSATNLNRSDLYNLTGEDREWAIRIMTLSLYSQAANEDRTHPDFSQRHMNPELALLLKDQERDWSDDIKEVIDSRGLSASEIHPDLVTGVRVAGGSVMKDGML